MIGTLIVNREIEKRYFSMHEVCQMFDCRPAILRFYEQELKLPIKKHGTKPHGMKLLTLIFEARKYFSLEGLRLLDLNYLEETLNAVKENLK